MLVLASVNIEGDNHLPNVLDFLESRNPDIVCFQELFQKDLAIFGEKYPFSFYIPTATVLKTNKFRVNPQGPIGVGIFSKFPIEEPHACYYVKHPTLPELVDGQPNAADRVILKARIKKADQFFDIATTHFTWSPGGMVTDEQRNNLNSMLSCIEKQELVLCGDFNAPRGGEIFSKLSTHMKDNIPKEITTTIDQKLHRISGIQFVVDGMFGTQRYSVTNVEVVDAVSDHCAIIGNVEIES